MTANIDTSLARAIDTIRGGQPVILAHGGRYCAVAPAVFADTEMLLRIESLTSAPIMIALDSATFDELGLGESESQSPKESPVGVPIDVGVSGVDAMSRGARATTMRCVGQGDLAEVRIPGHVPTVRSSPGNLLSRIGLVEAALDLVQLAGFREAATIAFLVDGLELQPSYPVVEVSEVRTAALTRVGGAADGDVKSLFIGAMSRLLAPVAVITSSPNGEDPHGLVVSSITSYSADPPSVVFSVALSSRSYEILHETEKFAVHILSRGQDDLVRVFGSRASDKFSDVAWEMHHGVPILKGAQTRLICRKIAELRLGDHALFVGAIIDGEASGRQPMAYFDRKFSWELTE